VTDAEIELQVLERWNMQRDRGDRWLVALRPDWPRACFRIHDAPAVQGWWTRKWEKFGGQPPIMLDVTPCIPSFCRRIQQAESTCRIGLMLSGAGYELVCPHSPTEPDFYDCTETFCITWLPLPPEARPPWTRALVGGDYGIPYGSTWARGYTVVGGHRLDDPWPPQAW